MPAPTQTPPSPPGTLKKRFDGLWLARLAGYGIGPVMIGFAVARAMRDYAGVPGWFGGLAVAVYILFGLLMLVPYARIAPGRLWRAAFGGLCAVAFVFVFVNVIDVLYIYQALSQAGEKPGPPGFRGLMLFAGLLQVPTVLFQRKPEMLA